MGVRVVENVLVGLYIYGYSAPLWYQNVRHDLYSTPPTVHFDTRVGQNKDYISNLYSAPPTLYFYTRVGQNNDYI